MPLEDDVRDLALRVARIEQTLGLDAAAAAAPPTPAQAVVATALTSGQLGRLPYFLGRLFLGLAGAYLLRALTESKTIGPAAGVGTGILYAVGWLIWAARVPATERAETALHGLTSVLVLSPLLWEATIRFGAITTWTASAILTFFILFGLIVSWRKNLLIVATIATVAGLATAAALLVATHDPLPFTLLFLTVAAAVETSACLNHWLSERWLAALAADLSVLLATWLVTNARGLPEGYAPFPYSWLLAALIALAVIYLSSTMVRTLLEGFTFTFFETAQMVVAVAIALNGCLRLAAEDPVVTPVVGGVMLACAIACYVISFLLPAGRNLYTYSTFALLLAIAGMRVLLPAGETAAIWLALAPVSVWFGKHDHGLAQFHGAIYLALGLVFSGMFTQATGAVLGTSTVPWLIVFATASAAACYALASTSLLRLAVAALGAWLLAAILASILTGGYHQIFGAEAPHSYCAALRTLVLAGGALGAAWAGSHWHRLELTRLIYPLMALAAWRLITQDIHQERKIAAMISMLVFGAALMLLSRRKSGMTADFRKIGA